MLPNSAVPTATADHEADRAATRVADRAADRKSDDKTESPRKKLSGKPGELASETVQMRVRPSTLKMFTELQQLLGSANRTRAIVRAVRIVYDLAKAHRDGHTLILRKNDNESELRYFV